MTGMTIKKNFIVVGGVVLTAIGLLAGAFAWNASMVKHTISEEAQLRADLQQVTAVKLATLEVLLTAMDALVDKSEGQMSAERIDTVKSNGAVIGEGLKVIQSTSLAKLGPQAAPTAQSSFEAMIEGASVDLPAAISGNAPESRFAELDDKIDGSGEALLGVLDEASKTLETALDASAAENARQLDQSTMLVLGGALIALLGVSMLLLGFARSILKPVNALSGMMQDLAQGNYDAATPGCERGDEIGAMARSVEGFRANLAEGVQLRAQQEAEKLQAEADRRAGMLRMADDLEQAVGAAISDLSREAQDLEAAAQSMSAAATQTATQADVVAGSSANANDYVQNVAAATEELAASVREIAGRATASADVARQASGVAQDAQAQIENLNQATQRITEVVRLISDIAEQTNLLALNATIEAARAGEAGRGFAVVASEVKALADQTAKSTEEVTRHISSVQLETQTVSKAIETVADIIARINETSSAIAATVEEQGAATNEIATAAEAAATGTREASNNTHGVREAAQVSGEGANRVLASANQLAHGAETIRHELQQFLNTVRAA